nr:MAG TPA: hypothetical protein [Caudoviricetes sp.]
MTPSDTGRASGNRRPNGSIGQLPRGTGKSARASLSGSNPDGCVEALHFS